MPAFRSGPMMPLPLPPRCAGPVTTAAGYGDADADDTGIVDQQCGYSCSAIVDPSVASAEGELSFSMRLRLSYS